VELLLRVTAPNTESYKAAPALDGIVDAAVLSVFPTDRQHLNPTFAFCASTGLQRNRIRQSIANGCFQTLRAFGQASHDHGPLGRSVRALINSQRFPTVLNRYELLQTAAQPVQQSCPYFRFKNGPFTCPFAETGAEGQRVYDACVKDTVHARTLVSRPKSVDLGSL
jgi:hypothetical protein